MAFNYVAMQARAAKLIAKYGMPAKLSRNGVLRDCIVVETGFDPREDRGKLENPTDRVFIVQAKDLQHPPNKEAGDILITFKFPTYTDEDDRLKMRTPAGRLSPANLPIYWEMQVYK